MFWDKKKEKGLPNLPPTMSGLPQPPKREAQNSEPKQSLPSFPDAAHQRGFSQAAIKDAIALPPTPKNNPTTEMDDEDDTMDAPPISPRIPKPPVDSFNPQVMHQNKIPDVHERKKNEDVFVQIEKFRDAKKALSEIQTTMVEMDTVLKKIKETKSKEEKELASWESEVDKVKSKMKEVVENIFEKVD